LLPVRDDLFDWILRLGPSAKFNLTSSGLTEPPLKEMGIDTSFEHFRSEGDLHERVFAAEVARLYRVEPENVVVTAGGTEAIFMVYSVFGNGGRVLVPTPNYPAMFTVPRSLGMKVQDLSGRPRLGGALLGLTDPNNPTGLRLDAGFVDDLVRSSNRGGGTVYINETYKEFGFSGEPGTYFDGSGGIITSGTMTKFFGLGRLRVGWILADSKKARQLHYAKWAVSGHDSEYSLWIAAQVLRKRTGFVERARQIYEDNSRLVRKFLDETRGVSAELGVAPFCLVRYEKGPASAALARRALKSAGVLVSPGDFFRSPRSFRLCFTASERTVKEGLEALSGFFGRTRGKDPSP
jgi:aspartate/methionine/tyrosine aminotransferase